jgi:hypothetical protein
VTEEPQEATADRGIAIKIEVKRHDPDSYSDLGTRAIALTRFSEVIEERTNDIDSA